MRQQRRATPVRSCCIEGSRAPRRGCLKNQRLGEVSPPPAALTALGITLDTRQSAPGRGTPACACWGACSTPLDFNAMKHAQATLAAEVSAGAADPAPGLDAKKVFEVHLDALKDAYKELVDANQKIAAILLIVLGWFVSKDNPLSMLCASPRLAELAAALALAGFFGLAQLFNLIAMRGAASRAALMCLGYAPELYARYAISKPMLRWGLFGQFALLFGIFALILVKYRLQPGITCHV
jgi:hypothetical protein